MGLNTREYHFPYSQTKKTIQKIFLGIICDMELIEQYVLELHVSSFSKDLYDLTFVLGIILKLYHY